MDKRDLPWRPRKGRAPDPYAVWLSEIMLQQTTVAHARPYFEHFLHRWPDIASLAAAEEGEVMAAWAGLGYYARARNLLACARAVARDHEGRFPADQAALRRLPGIGDYTAAAIAAFAFRLPALPIDANVERIIARFFAVGEPLPAARARLRRLAQEAIPVEQGGGVAEAMMELGQRICLPRRTDCPACPLQTGCAAARRTDPTAFPVRAAKRPKPRRHGVAYWLQRGDEVLLVRRPGEGLLGGMLALPTDADGPPARADWREAGSVDHVFTHFSLRMQLLCARLDEAGDGRDPAIWWPVGRIAEAGLPTLFARLAERGTAWQAGA